MNNIKGSILIFGANHNKRQQKSFEILKTLNLDVVENPDVLIIECKKGKNSIGIDQSREIKKFLSNKPLNGKYKAVYISKAEKLTTAAQNSLLKTLEEPPSYATIILNAKTQDSVLETIISRCQKISLKNDTNAHSTASKEISDNENQNKNENSKKSKKTEQITYLQLIEKKVENRLIWAETTSKLEKPEIIEYLEKLIFEARSELLLLTKKLGILQKSSNLEKKGSFSEKTQKSKKTANLKKSDQNKKIEVTTKIPDKLSFLLNYDEVLEEDEASISTEIGESNKSIFDDLPDFGNESKNINELNNSIEQLYEQLNYTAKNIENIQKIKNDLENTNVNARLGLELLSIKVQN